MARAATLAHLAWLVAGVPLILWTLSGLVMVARPIDEVRGSDLRSEAPALPAALVPTPPALGPRPVAMLDLAMRGDRPVWMIHYADDGVRAADAATGALLPAVTAADARAIADAALKTPASVVSVRRFAADANPIDLRRDRPAWQVHYADGLNVYIDADSGAVLAVCTRFWRTFDFFWGLHIMDLQTREDNHHPLLIGFAALAFVTVLLGAVMLFRRRGSARQRA